MATKTATKAKPVVSGKSAAKRAPEKATRRAALRRTVNFVFAKETKGAVQYTEVDECGMAVELADTVIGSLYLRKSALGDGKLPQRVSVTVETH